MPDENLTNDAVIDEQKPAEKMLSQSEVNAIVGREKQAAAERARREAEQAMMERFNQQQAQQAQAQAPAQAAIQAAQGQGAEQQAPESGQRELDVDAIYQQLQERLNQERQQQALEAEMTRVANSYMSKMEQGKELYDDFADITKDFDPAAFPQVTYLLADIDNAADIAYELAKNPSKLVTIDAMAQKSPNMARAELTKLGNSIVQNRQAQQEAMQTGTDAPLDRLQPSRVTQGNGKLSISDLRSQPWLRG